LFDLTSIACPSASVCRAVGQAGTVDGPPAIVGTNDGGAAWSTESAPSGLYHLSSIACASPTACSAVGQATLNGPGAAIGTSDGGSTWANETTPTANNFLGASCPRVGQCTAVGNSASSGAIIIGQGPITAVLFPSNGATVSGSAFLDASASSPVGLASVTFELTGGTLSDQVISGSTPTLYGWLGGWNTTTVPNGTYALQSVATDVDGVSTTSAPITITVSNPPPSTTVLLPSNGSTQSGIKYLDASASANVTTVVFEISGGTLTNQVISGSTPTIYGWIGGWNTATVPNGTYTLQSVASYANGASGTSPPITIVISN
jgi:hypothetical protein